MRSRTPVHTLILAAAAVLNGCAVPDEGVLTTGALPPSDERPQDEPVALGKLHYDRSDYGLAERYFRQAVERNPHSAEAWLGLAAAYDRLARFDLAERAYRKTMDLQGRSPAVLNNLGYHYLLAGDLDKAAAHLTEAAQKDPGNPLIEGNMRLLATWKTGEPS